MNTETNQLDLILGLPYKFSNRYGDNEEFQLNDVYLADRASIKDVVSLISFVHHWKNIWLLDEKIKADVPGNILGHEQETLDFVLNPWKLEYNSHLTALDILMPHTILWASMWARKYQVPFNLVFFRLFLEPYKEFDNWGR